MKVHTQLTNALQFVLELSKLDTSDALEVLPSGQDDYASFLVHCNKNNNHAEVTVDESTFSCEVFDKNYVLLDTITYNGELKTFANMVYNELLGDDIEVIGTGRRTR